MKYIYFIILFISNTASSNASTNPFVKNNKPEAINTIIPQSDNIANSIENLAVQGLDSPHIDSVGHIEAVMRNMGNGRLEGNRSVEERRARGVHLVSGGLT